MVISFFVFALESGEEMRNVVALNFIDLKHFKLILGYSNFA